MDWHGAVASLPQGLALLDADGRVVAANPAFLRFVGLEALEDAVPLTELLARVAGEAVRETRLTPSARLEIVAGERVLEVTLTPLGSTPGASCLVRDVTEERRARTELQKDGARFRLLANSGLLGIATSKVDGSFTYANDALLTMLGFTREDFDAGRVRWDALTPPEYAEIDRRATEQLLTTGVAMSVEKEFFRKDGSRMPALLFAGLIFEGRAEALGLILDMSDRKRLDDAIARRAGDLADEARRKDEFVAMLAHELRSPLAAITTAVQLQRHASDGVLPERRRELLERQTTNLRRIVDDLLDVSRISHGRIELNLARMDVADVVRRCLDWTAPRFEERGLRLVQELPATRVPVLADATRLDQVLMNLLENALKYTQPGGRVDVRLAVEDAAAVLQVRDDGIGFAPDQLPRAFEPFVRFNSGGPARGGLGLGLTLVRDIVGAHGGQVSARSDGLGRGATFVVRLPLAPAEHEEPRPDETAPSAGPRPRDVLLVEDNADAREALVELLRFHGHEVRGAEDGPSAVASARTRLPELVLLDIGLDGMDGYATGRALRALPGGERVRIVALTGFGLASDLRRSAEAGFDGHLVKPVDSDELLRVIAAERRDD